MRDRPSPYRSGTERLAAGVERSIGSVGDSYDNALAESINGLYETEVSRRRGPWRAIDVVEYATLVGSIPRGDSSLGFGKDRSG